jgi:hypothetical protein
MGEEDRALSKPVGGQRDGPRLPYFQMKDHRVPEDDIVDYSKQGQDDDAWAKPKSFRDPVSPQGEASPVGSDTTKHGDSVA